MRAAKALASLHICADSPEPSLFADVISTEITCTGLYLSYISGIRMVFCASNDKQILRFTFFKANFVGARKVCIRLTKNMQFIPSYPIPRLL